MTCPLTIRRLGTSPVVISDLNNLTLTNSTAIDIRFLSLDTISNSADLQTAINAGQIELSYLGNIITDLSYFCFNQNSILTPSWAWQAGLEGLITVAEIQLSRTNVAGPNTIPFFTFDDCELRTFTCTSQTNNADWAVLIQRATAGGNYTTVFTGLVDSQTKVFTPNIALSAQTRVRFIYQQVASNSILNPQAIALCVAT